MERRPAAILAADVVGHTRIMGADETGTLRRLTELRQEILHPLIAEHRGRIVKLVGDAWKTRASLRQPKRPAVRVAPSRLADQFERIIALQQKWLYGTVTIGIFVVFS